MGLSIKNSTAENLARRVAAEAGESLTEAIIHSLEERLERLKGRRSAPDLVETLLGISQRCRGDGPRGFGPRSRGPATGAPVGA